MVENNLRLLEENLTKKNELLDKMHELSDKQFALLDDADMEAEAFDTYMDEQDEFIKELLDLNEEAEKLYDQLRLENLSKDASRKDQMKKLKLLVEQIVDKTNSLQKKEQVNKQKLTIYFESERRVLGSGRRSSKAALDYFKSMNRSNVIPPQFMDQKK